MLVVQDPRIEDDVDLGGQDAREPRPQRRLEKRSSPGLAEDGGLEIRRDDEVRRPHCDTRLVGRGVGLDSVEDLDRLEGLLDPV